tara:strand:- start:1277 stop:1408 length:132 start_codon:yes stop_codon:yes gene_type:complete
MLIPVAGIVAGRESGNLTVFQKINEANGGDRSIFKNFAASGSG